jgi:hypothetical protein
MAVKSCRLTVSQHLRRGVWNMMRQLAVVCMMAQNRATCQTRGTEFIRSWLIPGIAYALGGRGAGGPHL